MKLVRMSSFIVNFIIVLFCWGKLLGIRVKVDLALLRLRVEVIVVVFWWGNVVVVRVGSGLELRQLIYHVLHLFCHVGIVVGLLLVVATSSFTFSSSTASAAVIFLWLMGRLLGWRDIWCLGLGLLLVIWGAAVYLFEQFL